MPIEEIVEFSLEMEIRPVRRLRHRFEVDGFLSADLNTVVVDEELLTRFPSRYCFTLAHEVAHRVLHSAQITWTRAENPAEWKERVMAIPRDDYSLMERQANEFAGCVLVPRPPLLAAYEEAAENAKLRGLDLGLLTDEELTCVADWIGRRFTVSGQAITRRQRREGLIGD